LTPILRESAPWRGHLLVLLLFLAFSVLFSWPFARFDPSALPTRHLDLYAVIWLIERVPTDLDLSSLRMSGSAWPFGEELGRLDSYLLLGLALLNRGLLPGWVLASLLAILGPTVNAFAAERCAARAFGVPRPWSLVAGFAYGFSGIVANVLLEGHVHQALNPWLPLLLLAAWTGTGSTGRAWHGLLAASAWILGLLGSAYLGVAATLLLIPLALLRWRAWGFWLAFASLALPVALFYTRSFLAAGAFHEAAANPETLLLSGSTTLQRLFLWVDGQATTVPSPAVPMGFATAGLALLALLDPGRDPRRRPERLLLASLTVLALLLALGRQIRVTDTLALPSPVALLAGIPGIQFLRFPIRMMWLWGLCGGILAAIGAAGLARHHRGPAVYALLGIVALDALVGTGLPLRLRRAIAATPTAYAAAPEGMPVLDLFGFGPGPEGALRDWLWIRNITCYYQASHGRPIPELCLGTRVQSPRMRLAAWLEPRLKEVGRAGEAGDPTLGDTTRARLVGLGIGAIALHADYLNADTLGMEAGGLERLLGPPVADTRDGGERVLLFEVQRALPADPLQVWTRFLAERSVSGHAMP
jgi:hypothetical protein